MGDTNLVKTKLMAFDLDGTLLADDKKLPEVNKSAMEAAYQAGIVSVIASGRPLSALPGDLLQLPEIRYAIASNGALVYRTADMKCLRKELLKPSSVEQILEFTGTFDAGNYPEGAGMPVACECFYRGRAYTSENYAKHPEAFGVDGQHIRYVKKTRQPVPDIRSFIYKHKRELAGIDLIFGDMDLRKKVLDKLRGQNFDIRITYSVANRIEMSSGQVGKESALGFLTGKMKGGLAAAAAFGDADNDVTMLRAAGIGIAVGNGTATCREAADRVVAGNNDGGAAEGIRYLIDRNFMIDAIEEAHKAEALDEVPIGCVIVKDGKIIGRGYNRRNTDANTLSHAELNAIRQASKKLGDWRLEGCTMYVTLEPCQMCAGALVQSRIDRVVIGSFNRKAGCCGSVINLVRNPDFNHQVEITGGILKEECSSMLTDFFQKLRLRRSSGKNAYSK